MKNTEKLAVLTALKKSIETQIKKIRSAVDSEMREAFVEDSVEKKALKVGGQKVGEIIVTYASDGFEISDKSAFEEFALDYGLATVRKTIKPEMMESAIRALEGVFDAEVLAETISENVVISNDWEKSMKRISGGVSYMDSGLVVPGVEYRPKLAKGTMVKDCKPETVIPILQTLPGGIDGLLLGGGVDA